jgi:hypothetical protein
MATRHNKTVRPPESNAMATPNATQTQASELQALRLRSVSCYRLNHGLFSIWKFTKRLEVWLHVGLFSNTRLQASEDLTFSLSQAQASGMRRIWLQVPDDMGFVWTWGPYSLPWYAMTKHKQAANKRFFIYFAVLTKKPFPESWILKPEAWL